MNSRKAILNIKVKLLFMENKLLSIKKMNIKLKIIIQSNKNFF